MAYLVLARKYRPQGFGDLVGQEHVAKTLGNALEAVRLAQAYVFSGPRGCGKTTTARILAKALNCVKGPTPQPCGECPQCLEISTGNSTGDVLEIDGASTRGIEQIRDLRDTVKYSPSRSRYRVIIIDEAHQITKEGWNALLKTLEEPPAHVVFMMATTEAQKIPETILSRCQRFQLRSIGLTDIFNRLQKIVGLEKLAVEDAALHEVARAARGSLRDALSLLDQLIAYKPQGASAEDVRNLLGLLPGEFVREFSSVLLTGTPSMVLQAIQKAVEDGVDLSQLAEDLMERRHSLLLWKAGVKDSRSPDGADMEKESALLSQERVERDLAVLSRTTADMRRSESPRVTFELACLDMAQDAQSVQELVERLEMLERSLRTGSTPPPRPSRVAPPPPPVLGALSPPPEEVTPMPLKGPLDQAVLATAWKSTVEEVLSKKPALGTWLAGARCVLQMGNKISVNFPHDFARTQATAQEKLWGDVLKKNLGNGTVSIQCGTDTTPPPPPPEKLLTKETPPPENREIFEEDMESPPQRTDQTIKNDQRVDMEDPGLKRVLSLFPGTVRPVEK